VEKHTATSARHIILIRHGQYNLGGVTDQEMALTRLGDEQSTFVGERLKTLGVPITKIVSSDMMRAKQTACVVSEVLCDGKETKTEIVYDPLLREGVPSLPDPPLQGPSWGVPMSEVYEDGARIEAAFRKYIHRAPPSQKEDSYEAIICHGNVIRYFICRALQFPGEGWLRLQVDNASMTTLSILPEGDVFVQSVGDTGHIPPEKVTAT